MKRGAAPCNCTVHFPLRRSLVISATGGVAWALVILRGHLIGWKTDISWRYGRIYSYLQGRQSGPTSRWGKCSSTIGLPPPEGRKRGRPLSHLRKQAIKDQSAFLVLLGKVLPLQVAGDANIPLKVARSSASLCVRAWMLFSMESWLRYCRCVLRQPEKENAPSAVGA